MTRTLSIRPATPKDVSTIRKIDEGEWDDSGADDNKILSRIKTFPEGSFLVMQGDKILVYCALMIPRRGLVEANGMSWASVTDDGLISKTHDLNGDYVYGINITAHPDAPQGASAMAVRHGQALCVHYKKKALVLGSRISGFSDWKKKNTGSTAQQYLDLYLQGNIRDPHLSYFERLGFLSQRLLPDYFPDPVSHDYGVLVKFVNPEMPGPGLFEAYKSVQGMMS